MCLIKCVKEKVFTGSNFSQKDTCITLQIMAKPLDEDTELNRWRVNNLQQGVDEIPLAPGKERWRRKGHPGPEKQLVLLQNASRLTSRDFTHHLISHSFIHKALD